MDPLLQILRRLKDQGVEFVVIGGIAAVAHGSPMITQDVDVCAPMTDENLTRILDALRPIHPRLRFRPDHMPLPDDVNRLRGIRNMNLLTDLGVVDLLSEITGVGTFADLLGRTLDLDIGGFRCQVLDLDTLITAKKAAGRDKDKLAVRHLEAIKKMRRDQPGLFDPPEADRTTS